MIALLNDLRFGVRQLATKPGFAAAAILTLALGIGANTAVFSVLSGYLLKPLPYPHSGQLAEVGVNFKADGSGNFSMSVPLYELIRKDTTAFLSMAIYNYNDFNAEIGGASTDVPGVLATGSLFNVLGVAPALGHTFTADSSEPGQGGVAIISHRLWRSRFGADPSVIGRTIRLNGKPVRIIGVMPKGFVFPDRSVDIWAPMTISPKDRSVNHRMFFLSPTFIGRLKPGVGLNALQTQLDAVRTQVGRMVPAKTWHQVTNAGFFVHAKAYRQTLLNGRTSTLLLLQAAVFLVLLMTCVNVANLLLSRVLGRSHEIAMRSALGATRAALTRQLLIESLCLAIPGGAVGVALGWLGLHYYTVFASGVDGIFNTSLDWRVGLAALAMVCVTTALVSVLPIRHLAKTDLHSLLQTGGRASGDRGARRVRNTLVTIELTLATALLAASGLLLHSFINLQAVNPGFRTHNVLIAGLLVPDNDHVGNKALNNFHAALLQRVRALPGVKAAGIGTWLPFGYSWQDYGFLIRGRDSASTSIKKPAEAWFDSVDGGYFKALGLPILRGRNFGARDTAGSAPVAIVNANVVKKYFGGASPLGRQIKLGKTWYTIVGVVPAIKAEDLTERDPATVYLNAAQVPARGVHLVVHTAISPKLLDKSLRKAVAAVDPAVAVYDVETMHARLASSLQDRQGTMALLIAFGGIALALAVVGVYGVLSYGVRRRVTECGVRLALGALPADLLWLIIRDGLKLLAIGLILGLVLAVIFGYVLASRLFGVVPFDPLTLIGTTLVLSGITLVACYLPARRAAGLDPAIAMMDQ